MSCGGRVHFSPCVGPENKLIHRNTQHRKGNNHLDDARYVRQNFSRELAIASLNKLKCQDFYRRFDCPLSSSLRCRNRSCAACEPGEWPMLVSIFVSDRYSARTTHFRFLIAQNDHHWNGSMQFRSLRIWILFSNKIINSRGQYYHRLNGSVRSSISLLSLLRLRCVVAAPLSFHSLSSVSRRWITLCASIYNNKTTILAAT